jgi:hypothetical protein
MYLWATAGTYKGCGGIHTFGTAGNPHILHDFSEPKSVMLLTDCYASLSYIIYQV